MSMCTHIMLINILSRPFLLHYSERKVKREGSLNSKRLLVVYLIFFNVFFIKKKKYRIRMKNKSN